MLSHPDTAARLTIVPRGIWFKIDDLVLDSCDVTITYGGDYCDGETFGVSGGLLIRCGFTPTLVRFQPPQLMYTQCKLVKNDIEERMAFIPDKFAKLVVRLCS